MAQLSFRVSDDVADAFERGRQAQGFNSGTEYFAALVREAGGQPSGIGPPIWQAAATDARLSNAVARALAAVKRDEKTDAVEALQLARDLLMEVFTSQRYIVDSVTQERLRIRGGNDDWERAERSRGR